MRRFWGWTLGAVALLAVAMVATLPTRLGFPLWHHNVAFLVTLGAAAAAWPLLLRRRVATMGMALMAVAATVTGFAMLYTKQFAYKEWLTWWHSVTSFALTVAFLVHWLHNHVRLADFTRRLVGRERALGLPAAVGWAGVAAAGVWTWTAPEARAAFTSENYLYLASWAVFLGVAVTYGVWLAFRVPVLRARLADRHARNRARAVVDTSLFLACWASLLTGFALLWLAAPLRGGDLKYVSKWWHTATSVAFLALVVLHVGFNARVLAAHARRIDDDLAPSNS